MPIRIGHFIDTRVFGGAEALAIQLCGDALQRGDAPILLHFGHEKMASKVAALGVPERVLPDEELYKSTRTLPRFARSLRRVLAEEEIDVLHSHLFGPVCGGALATAFSPVLHVGTLHDSYTFEDRPALARGIQAAVLLNTQVVAVSHSIESVLRRYAWFGRRSLEVIHNGVPIPELPSHERIAQVRASLGLDADDLVVCCVGRLVPIKGHQVLLQAWSRLSNRDRRKLWIIGDGPEREALTRYCNELGLSDSVSFLGFRNDVSDLLFAADAFVLPSFSEGLSCSLLEAMGHGLPAVATRVGGNPELVDEGVSGYLVAPGDAPALARALEDLLSREGVIAAFSAAARGRAESQLSAEAMADAYWRLYETANG